MLLTTWPWHSTRHWTIQHLSVFFFCYFLATLRINWAQISQICYDIRWDTPSEDTGLDKLPNVYPAFMRNNYGFVFCSTTKSVQTRNQAYNKMIQPPESETDVLGCLVVWSSDTTNRNHPSILTMSKPKLNFSTKFCSLSTGSPSSMKRHVCRPSTLERRHLVRSVAGSVLWGPPRFRRPLMLGPTFD